MPKVAKKLSISAGDDIGKKSEQKIKLIPSRFRLEQCPIEKGARQNRILENQVLNTEGEVGNTKLRRESRKRTQRPRFLGESVPNKKKKVLANSEKCHPDTEKRWDNPLLLNSSLCL